MIPIRMIEANIPADLVREDITAGEKAELALPVKAGQIVWQVNLDDATPPTLDMQLEMSIDRINWFSVSAIDETDFVLGVYLAALPDPIGAIWVRLNVVANGSGVEVTAIIVVKPIT